MLSIMPSTNEAGMCCTQTALILGARNTAVHMYKQYMVLHRVYRYSSGYVLYIYMLPLVLVVMGTSTDLPLDEIDTLE